MAARKQRSPDEPFLTPIEDPEDPSTKQLYARQEVLFGKVLTPTKVLLARLPPVFAQLYGKGLELDKELSLPPENSLLVRQLVAQINVCLFCIDSVRAATIRTSMNQAKFDALAEYATSPLYTDADRAALDYVTELTKNKKVESATFDRIAKYYSEREICEIVYLVAFEHLHNVTNNGLNIHSDLICDIAKKRKYG